MIITACKSDLPHIVWPHLGVVLASSALPPEKEQDRSNIFLIGRACTCDHDYSWQLFAWGRVCTCNHVYSWRLMLEEEELVHVIMIIRDDSCLKRKSLYMWSCLFMTTNAWRGRVCTCNHDFSWQLMFEEEELLHVIMIICDDTCFEKEELVQVIMIIRDD